MSKLICEEKFEYEDILARRQENINYYDTYFLKLDLKEHIAQLRMQKANNNIFNKGINRKELISNMQKLCTFLYFDFKKEVLDKIDENNDFDDLIRIKENIPLVKKKRLARRILKELKLKGNYYE